MQPYQQECLSLFKSPKVRLFGEISSADLGIIYGDICYLSCILHGIQDEFQFQRRKPGKQDLDYGEFLKPFLTRELSIVDYLVVLVQGSQNKQINALIISTIDLTRDLVLEIKSRSYFEKKIFCQFALGAMTELYKFEILMAESSPETKFSLYRTYDGLDEILEITYLYEKYSELESTSTERLYKGSGVGVQSSYSTILMALQHLDLSSAVRFLDLGSGYGRIGFVIGLLYPHINFKGYEFVRHRVDLANSVSKNFSLQPQVQFLTQDLSLPDFALPDAEIYYMYDPFCEKTYQSLMLQIANISTRMKVSVVTKGHASHWILGLEDSLSWPRHLELDGGNLCIFHSR